MKIDPSVLERIAEENPQHRYAVRRLSSLIEDKPPTVVVLGKYNHGKSSLLNVLLGDLYYGMSDKRETRCNQTEEHGGLRWIDTPGLNADSTGEDDRSAIYAATLDADLCLFVHAADQGELDRMEADWIGRLENEQSETGRAFLLVLTRIDKVTAEDRDLVIKKIRHQARRAQIVAASAHAWERGRNEGKPALQMLGNIEALKSEIQKILAKSDATRDAERTRLAQDVVAAMDKKFTQTRHKLDELRAIREQKLKFLVLSISNQLRVRRLELMNKAVHS